MESHLRDRIRQNAVFTGLSPEEQDFLAREGIRRDYKVGEALVRAGDPWPYLFLVVQGKIKALKESPEGRSLVVAELDEGDIFWGLAFFEDGLNNPVTFQVSKPACVYLWERTKMQPILMGRGQFTWELSKIMVKRMLQASEVIEGLAFQPVAGRLARLLVEFPGKASSGPTIRSLTLDEMAARIGSTREMVCRFLQRFADDGLIKITRTEFEVMDGGKLMEMAQKVKP